MNSPEASPAPQETRFSLTPQRCWLIVALISVVALINYFDRQSLSVVAPRFQMELHLSDAGYGHVVSLFLLASAFSYAVSGMLTDWLGTRTSMALFVGWWSLAEAVTAFVTTTTQLAAARFCLGLGEPGLWVAAPKAVAEILPKKHHSLAIGVYTLGSTVGAVIALPTIAAITTHLPWKSVFILDGCAGILWLPFWLATYPNGKAQRAAAASLKAAAALADPGAKRAGTLKDVLSQSKTWKFLIARGMTDPVWFFYLFWFPKYLLGTRGLSMAEVARIGWLVYLFAGVGTLLGGLVSGWLIRRGTIPARAYRNTMLACAVLVPLSPLAGLVSNALVAVCIASLIALAHMAWLVTLSSAVIDLFPSSEIGKAFGMIAAGSAFGGMISTEIIAHVVTYHGYLPLFFIMMVLHPIALVMLWTTFREKVAAVAPA